MRDVTKNESKKFFEPVAVVFFIMMGQRIYTFMTNSLENSLSV